jgi:hypothetical protein
MIGCRIGRTTDFIEKKRYFVDLRVEILILVISLGLKN